METWKDYLSSSIAGIFTIAQLICFFFFQIAAGSSVLRILGWLTWAISVLFGVLPILIFRKQAGVPKGESFVKTTVLVERGLYGIVRHPQYLAGILLNLALMLISQHWLIVLLGIPPIVLMYIDIYKADQHEIEKFGQVYREYMERVPRMNFILGIIRQIQRRSK